MVCQAQKTLNLNEENQVIYDAIIAEYDEKIRKTVSGSIWDVHNNLNWEFDKFVLDTYKYLMYYSGNRLNGIDHKTFDPNEIYTPDAFIGNRDIDDFWLIKQEVIWYLSSAISTLIKKFDNSEDYKQVSFERFMYFFSAAFYSTEWIIGTDEYQDSLILIENYHKDRKETVEKLEAIFNKTMSQA